MTSHSAQQPSISIVMPAYNEEEIVGYTVRRLVHAFENAGYALQLVVVDNGSRDRTGDIIRKLATEMPAVIPHHVAVNQGYGYGVTSGFPLCTARWIGWIPADGQVDAEDVVRLYETIANTDGKVLAKVRRRFRMDGMVRKIVSISYNAFVWVLWPTLGSLDLNGVPKILPREVLQEMRVTSRQWFLDPEIMIKAHYMGIRVLELNVFARMRGGGLSHVRASTCWEFFRNLLIFRFSPSIRAWRLEANAAAPLPNAEVSVNR
ncbi:MAG: glycosyltransferase family 2 protein [Gemmatimonadaceae bacterium]|nr:glycosyltransferase family 2 protein [Gemmatimonadaceae bacterium]MDQ3519389.1 glycosyltransferase family 2 protein [Gemmatimonadota bacterium]